MTQRQQLRNGLEQRVAAEEFIAPQATHHHLQSRIRRLSRNAVGVEAIGAGLIQGIKERRQTGPSLVASQQEAAMVGTKALGHLLGEDTFIESLLFKTDREGRQPLVRGRQDRR